MTYSKPRKIKTILFSIVAIIIVAGLAVGATLALTKHGAAKSKSQGGVQQTTATTSPSPDASQYKLTACKSGTTENIANAGYLVGIDIAPGNYKIVSQAAGIGWTNIDIYNSKSDYNKAQDPNSNVADNSIQATNSDDSAVTPAPTYTKLSDGQYVNVSADPSTFTCE